MAVQKKHGKGRLDKWYRLAKEKGYRARAAFKLIQLNKRYHVLENSRVLLDLCAAPGSWSQVAAETMPSNGIIVAVDLAPIRAIPRVISLQQDITSDQCRAQIRSHLKDWKVDTVLHDGAPNVGVAWVQDAYSQAELVLQALKLATVFLIEGGTFITKVFRSKDYNNLLFVLNQLFGKVEATKPPSSRNVSAEIFVVCRQFKAPARIDPRLLDPKSVFAELTAPTPNYEAKVFNPEVKKRRREGYEEGDYTQYKEILVSSYIESTDPISILGSYNRICIPERDPTSEEGDMDQVIARLPETTDEIKSCCRDIRILGKKDFRQLLRWRLKLREKLGLAPPKADENKLPDGGEVITVEGADEDELLLADLERLKTQERAKRKREKRKENEMKTKEIRRLQLHMVAPLDVGMEQNGPIGQEFMFTMPPAKRQKRTGPIPDETEAPGEYVDSAEEESADEDQGDLTDGTTDENDDLEDQLDSMYEQYQERQAEKDTKYKAKKARKEMPDDEWAGFDENAAPSEDELKDEVTDVESDSDVEELRDEDDADGDDDETPKLSTRAAAFFNQEIIKDISGTIDNPSQANDAEASNGVISRGTSATKSKPLPIRDASTASKTEKRPAKHPAQPSPPSPPSHSPSPPPPSALPTPKKDTRSIEIITLEAMTLAQNLALGHTTATDLADSTYNRHAFRGDPTNLPPWFLDDERQFSRGPQTPTTRAAADALKARLRAINARPIKKVREALARKKMRAATRLERLRKKSALVIEADEGMSEKDKAGAIARMMSRARNKGGKKGGKNGEKERTRVVVARGANRGVRGRPGGVKGRYKIVDPRLKKDVRALKRLGKLAKGSGRGRK